MKQLSILALLILLCQSAFTQDCSVLIEENENGTYGKNVETSELLLGKNVGRINFELFLESLEIQYWSNNENLKKPKFNIEFTLSNSDTIVLLSRIYGDKIGEYSNPEFGYKNGFGINLTILSKMEENLITGFREGESTDFTQVKEKYAIQIQNLAKCFRQSFDDKKDILLSYTELPESNCGFLKYEIDPISDEINKELDWTRVAYDGQEKEYGAFMVVSPRARGNTNFISIGTSNSNYCLNDDSYVIFKLENGNKISLKHIGGIDCGRGDLKALLDSEIIERLKASPISFIRFYSADGYLDFDLVSEPNYFIDNIDCLNN